MYHTTYLFFLSYVVVIDLALKHFYKVIFGREFKTLGGEYKQRYEVVSKQATTNTSAQLRSHVSCLFLLIPQSIIFALANLHGSQKIGAKWNFLPICITDRPFAS